MSHMSSGNGSWSDRSWGRRRDKKNTPADWTLRMPNIKIPESIRQISAKRLTAIVVISVVAVFAFIIGLLQTSLFAVNRVDVTGVSHLKTADVLSLANVKLGSSMISVNDAKVSAQIETNPWVESALVRSTWPHQIIIKVTERTAIAQAQTTDKKWATIGTNGVVLQTEAAPVSNLPAFLNVTVPSQPGASLDASTVVLTTVAQAMPPSLAPHVRQIQFLDNDLKLGLDTGTIVEMGDGTDLDNKLMAAASVVSHTDSKTLKILDVRSPHLPVATPVIPLATTTTTAAPKSGTTTTTVKSSAKATTTTLG